MTSSPYILPFFLYFISFTTFFGFSNSASSQIINEFMAENSNVLDDEDGDSSDWIELKNTSSSSVDMGGWSLTDDPLLPQKWIIPAGTVISADGFLVVFASGKDRAIAGSQLHTNFQLNNTGEYLALTRPNGTIATEFAPIYPAQREDIAYGIPINGTVPRYLLTGTPDAENVSTTRNGFVEDTRFNIDRGFYDVTQNVIITSATPGATIVYTTDTSTPTLTNGTQVPAPNTTTPPTATITISSTTTLRAAAFLTNFVPTNTDTHTYVFLSDVVRQSPTGRAPAGWPLFRQNSQFFNYGMDPDIVNSAIWGPQMEDALLQIPSLSIVTDQANLTGADVGIYVNAFNDGREWERPASVELLLPDNTPAFQVNAGLRIRGNFSRNGNNPKHSFRLFFRREYGPSRLDYQLFGSEGADDFDKVDLRTAQNYAWSNETFNNDLHNTFIRDVYHRDAQRDLGQPYTRSRYYHLYLNGQYWGIYQTQERSESAYANTYFGGDRDGYDVVRPRNGAVAAVDGNLDAYNDLQTLAVEGFETDAAYFAAQGLNVDGSENFSLPVLIDVDNLIDYMAINMFLGNTDGPLTLGNDAPNNFYALRNRVLEARDPWRFFCHDSEHSMAAADHNISADVTTEVTTGESPGAFNPRWLSQRLAANENYTRRFGDRIHQYFFNDGPLTEANNILRWNTRANQIDLAIIAESARWGDQHNNPPRDKNIWQTEVNWITDTFLPNRQTIFLNQLRTAGLYPNVEAPAYNQHGGSVPNGFNTIITAPSGSIFYTTDGSDPRVPTTSSTTTLLAAGAPASALIPTADIGDSWKGGNEPFNDTAWLSGPTGIGFEGNSNGQADYTEFIGIDVTAMRNNIASVYARIPFTVTDPSILDALTLRMRYDDGFVAYLNGVEIASVFKPTPLVWNSATDGGFNHSDVEAVLFQDFDITAHLNLLNAGQNILAIHGLNANVSSSDMLLQPEITARSTQTNTSIPYTGPIPLTSQTNLKAAVLENGEWSALNVATFLIDTVPADSSNLIISEVHYRPSLPTAAENPGSNFDRGDFEFIELQNVGSSSIDLTSVTFTDGIDFQFTENTVLEPGEYAVLVKNSAAFALRYPGVSITGEFGGSLSNSGEQIILNAADSTDISNFTYLDQSPWPVSADGAGYSLVLSCSQDNLDPSHFSDPTSWRPSVAIHGSPGTSDTLAYSEWATANGITGGISDDDDLNGNDNLIDYATTGTPITSIVGNFFNVEIQRNLNADEANVIAEISTNLQTWTTISPISSTNSGNGTLLETYSIPLRDDDLDREFFRLRATLK